LLRGEEKIEMRNRGPVRLAVISLALLAGIAVPARADDAIFGVRFGYYTSAEDAFLGAEALARLAPRVYFNPNVEYVFTDGSTYMTFNGDFHYDFPTHSHAFLWLGAGLAVIYVNPDGSTPSNTDVGANFLAGVGWKSGSVIPYFQLKVIA
jgi:hypothetical protein